MGSKFLENDLKDVIKKERFYEFPEFLRQIRTALGPSRRKVSSDLDIPYEKLNRLEHGEFKTFYLFEINALAEYYGIQRSLLTKKCKKFLKETKCES